MTEITDENIAQQVQNGDSQAFGILVDRYEAKLLRYARRFLFQSEDAEDMIQEVFLKAYSNIQSFDSKRSFNSWIYRIAHNHFINTIKKKGTEPLSFFDPDTLFPMPRDPNQADDKIKDDELRTMMDQCLDQLNPKYREVFVLYYYEDIAYKEIAEILHIPVSTVGVRLNRGKTALQNIYKKLHLKHERP